MASGRCPDGSGFICKILSESECDTIKKCIITSSPLYAIDEVKAPNTGSIGRNQDNESNNWHEVNNQVIFEWRVYARRFNAKPDGSDLVAIRDFERTIEGKPFNLIKTGDVATCRITLIEHGKRHADTGGFGKSTIRYRASHPSKFFERLCKQEGYWHLNASRYEYIRLPRCAIAQALPMSPKPFPTIDEAIAMAGYMPERTRLDRRNRVIFAIAFVLDSERRRSFRCNCGTTV